MKFQKRLHQITSCDEAIANLPKIEIFSSVRDHNHLNRRLQQRAINWDMIKLAIAYGKFQYHSGVQPTYVQNRTRCKVM